MAKKAKAAEAPTFRVVSISDLVPDPTNVRVHDDRSKGALTQSLKELGAGRSVVVDADGVVRAGNGTLEAAKAAGIEEAVVVETDGRQLVVVKRPDWTPEQALAYAIADNRTGELSWFDPEKLGAEVTRLAEQAVAEGSRVLIDTLGFEERELNAILTRAGYGPGLRAGDVDANSEWGGMPAYEHEDKRAHRSIVVHFHDEKAIADFEAKLGVKLPEKARYLWWPEIIIESHADKRWVEDKTP